MSGSTPVVSQSIMKPIVPVGASTVACALRKPCCSPSSMTSSHTALAASNRSFGMWAAIDVLERRAVLAHDAQERLAVLLVAGERTAVIARDLRRLRVRRAVHQRGDRRRVVAAGVAVVGQAARHQQRAEVGVAEAERTDRRGCSSRSPASDSSSCRPGSPAR